MKQEPYKVQHCLEPLEYELMMSTARAASEYMREEFRRLISREARLPAPKSQPSK